MQNGGAIIEVLSGQNPVVITWSNGQIGPEIVGLSAGIYTATLTDAVGCTAQTSVNIAAATPTVLGIAATQTSCNFDSVAFGLVANYVGNLGSIGWFLGSLPLGIGDSITAFLGIESATIYAISTSSEGCLDTADVQLLPTVLSVGVSADSMVCRGGAMSANAVTDALNPTFSWASAAMILSGGNTAQPIINTEISGSFVLTVTVSSGASCPAQATLTVEVLDSLHEPNLDLLTYSQCEGLTVAFQNPEISPYYFWNFGDLTNQNDTSSLQNPTYTYPENGNYTVHFVPTGACGAPIDWPIEVSTAPVVDFGATVPICQPVADITFEDQSNVAGGVTAYNWVFGTLGVSNIASPTLAVSASVTLPVSLTIGFGNGCSLTANQTVVVAVYNPLLPPSSVTACRGATVGLNPGFDTTLGYLWAPNDGTLSNNTIGNPTVVATESATYTVSVSNGACFATAEVVLNVAPDILLEVSNDTTTCTTDIISLFASATQSLLFLWADNAAFTNPMSTLSELLVSPAQPSWYYVQATDIFGCQLIDSVQVSNMGVGLDLLGNTTICHTSLPEITALPSGNGAPFSLTWLPYDPNFDVLDSVTTFTAQLTNSFGCAATETITITPTNPTNSVNILATPDTIFRGDETQLVATQINGLSYNWQPEGSLNFAHIATPIAKPDSTTTYFLTVTDSLGCTGEDSIVITVLDARCGEPNIYFPNAFSPNQDNHNELLRVRGLDLTEVYLVVYNRWGEPVFETKTQAEGWDGTFRGVAVSPDVYGYYLRVRCENGEAYFKKGNVTVLK